MRLVEADCQVDRLYLSEENLSQISPADTKPWWFSFVVIQMIHEIYNYELRTVQAWTFRKKVNYLKKNYVFRRKDIENVDSLTFLVLRENVRKRFYKRNSV